MATDADNEVLSTGLLKEKLKSPNSLSPGEGWGEAFLKYVLKLKLTLKMAVL